MCEYGEFLWENAGDLAEASRLLLTGANGINCWGVSLDEHVGTFLYLLTSESISLEKRFISNNVLQSLSSTRIVQNSGGGNLEALSLSETKMKSSCILLRAICSHAHLRYLDLRKNNICCKGAKLIAEGLKVNPPLEELLLSFNNIKSSGGVKLAKSLVFNDNLVRLDLTRNKIGNKAVKEFHKKLKVNNTLCGLSLRQNNIFHIRTLYKIHFQLKRNQKRRERSELEGKKILQSVAGAKNQIHVRSLREKLIIVGESNSGVTSLIQTILNLQYTSPKKDEISVLKAKIEDGKWSLLNQSERRNLALHIIARTVAKKLQQPDTQKIETPRRYFSAVDILSSRNSTEHMNQPVLESIFSSRRKKKIKSSFRSNKINRKRAATNVLELSKNLAASRPDSKAQETDESIQDVFVNQYRSYYSFLKQTTKVSKAIYVNIFDLSHADQFIWKSIVEMNNGVFVIVFDLRKMCGSQGFEAEDKEICLRHLRDKLSLVWNLCAVNICFVGAFYSKLREKSVTENLREVDDLLQITMQTIIGYSETKLRLIRNTSQLLSFFPIDSVSKYGISTLLSCLEDALQKEEQLCNHCLNEEMFPIAWIRILEQLELKTEPYISLTEYVNSAKLCGITTNRDLERSLKYLGKRGHFLYFGETFDKFNIPEPFLFLDIAWFINLVSSLLDTGKTRKIFLQHAVESLNPALFDEVRTLYSTGMSSVRLIEFMLGLSEVPSKMRRYIIHVMQQLNIVSDFFFGGSRDDIQWCYLRSYVPFRRKPNFNPEAFSSTVISSNCTTILQVLGRISQGINVIGQQHPSKRGHISHFCTDENMVAIKIITGDEELIIAFVELRKEFEVKLSCSTTLIGEKILLLQVVLQPLFTSKLELIGEQGCYNASNPALKDAAIEQTEKTKSSKMSIDFASARSLLLREGLFS
eukprot:snap_masked-scaffold_20-processed-gene-0.21-mRNA-1 protein AED:0.44 eAED:0.44 QI:0/0/0/0.33/1/1/3/0/922